MDRLILLATGGRTFSDRDWLWAGLDLLHSMQPITRLIEGGAPGFDVCAQEWAGRRGVPCTTVEAEWSKHGASAGPIRNTQMARMMPDVVLAGPGGKGTRSMIDIARAHGLRVAFLEKMPVARGPGAGATAPGPLDPNRRLGSR